MKACITDADAFSIIFPVNSTPQQKLLLTYSILLFDFSYFEVSPADEHGGEWWDLIIIKIYFLKNLYIIKINFYKIKFNLIYVTIFKNIIKNNKTYVISYKRYINNNYIIKKIRFKYF